MNIRRILCAAALGLLTASAASAQKLEAGLWTGHVVPPDMPPGFSVDLTFDVKTAADSLDVTMTFSIKSPDGNAPPPMSFKLNDIKVTAGKLSFSFTPGNAVVTCDLALQEDKSYAGDCTDGDDPARMIMIPPKKEGGVDL